MFGTENHMCHTDSIQVILVPVYIYQSLYVDMKYWNYLSHKSPKYKVIYMVCKLHACEFWLSQSVLQLRILKQSNVSESTGISIKYVRN